MKKFFLWVAVMALCPLVWAQNLHLAQNSYQKVSFTIDNGAISVENLHLSEGVFSVISMEGYAPSNDPGAPQLPVFSRMLQIPVCDSVVATVVSAQYTDYDAADLGVTHPLFPSQPSVAKNDPNPQFAYNQMIYTTNAFYSLPLVRVEKAGVKRNAALANVYVSPVQYNPVTGKIRVYSHVDLQFTFVNADMGATVALQKY
ncbi:MAG: hypothetical protein IKO09_06900, partial [Bacteroidales bacterium]|nr:hypothetical protein [Bacteroidales bacterium]